MKNSLFLLFVVTLATLASFSGCSKMDDTYKEFIKDGVIKYVGKADSVRVHPGRNRLQLRWLRSADPAVSNATIYWNSRSDSLKIPIDMNQDTIIVPFDNMSEGSYTFEIYTFDDKGNTSIGVEAIGRSYGNEYENALLTRFVNRTEFFGEDTVEVHFGNVTDTTLVATELIYENIDQIVDTLLIPSNELSVTLLKFPRGILKFRSFFKPSPFAIDMFYSRYDSIRVKGLPVEFEKTGWVATASSFDSRAGNSYRPASNAIDNNPSTIWVNQVNPQAYYPHWIQVDMGQIHEDIEGFAIITRIGDPAARPKTVEFLTSIDGDEWVSFGDFVLEDSGDKQFISIPEPVSAQYFKLIAKDPHRSGNNVAMAEIGVFTR